MLRQYMLSGGNVFLIDRWRLVATCNPLKGNTSEDDHAVLSTLRSLPFAEKDLLDIRVFRSKGLASCGATETVIPVKSDASSDTS